MKVLASLSILLALLVVSQATAETKSITIGKFTYVGTGTQTRSDGTVIQGVSSYELVFDTGGVTEEPMPSCSLREAARARRVPAFRQSPRATGAGRTIHFRHAT